MVIRKYQKYGDESDYIASREVEPSRESGWLMFEISNYVAELINKGTYVHTY